MRTPEFNYADPKSVREASRLLAAGAGDAHAIAGGTDLLMALKNGQKRPKLLVDLGSLPLGHITHSEKDGLKIGALVSLRHLAAHPVVREKYPILAQAARSVGAAQLQAMGTVGGNLCQDARCVYFDRSVTARRCLEPCHKLGGQVCHVVRGSEKCWASYAGDLAPALLVLRARLRVVDSRGEKVLPLGELFSGDGEHPHALRPGELVTEIQVPTLPPHSGSAYLKLRQRETLDYPALGVAAHVTLENGGVTCKQAALALTAVDRAPVLIEEASRLNGGELTGEAMQALAAIARKRAHPTKNVTGLPVRYRLKMVDAYVESALQQALSVAREAS